MNQITCLRLLTTAIIVWNAVYMERAIKVLREARFEVGDAQVSHIYPMMLEHLNLIGEFRFPALPPGEYQVTAELQGFGTVVRENIRLTTTTTLTVDFEMSVAAVEEEILVIGRSPTIDVRSTETGSVTLSNEILRNIPYSQFTAEIVNMAPGVHDEVAFGSSNHTGIAYSMDGSLVRPQ